MYCSICGIEIKKKRSSKWQNCGSAECRREAIKRISQKSKQDYYKRLDNPTPDRLKKINAMKRDMPDKESFAKALAKSNNRELARKYKLAEKEVTIYRKKLFGDIAPKEIHIIGKDLLRPLSKPLERIPIEVQVYKITEPDKIKPHVFGEKPRYDGLLFDRIEYANEIALHNKSEVLLEA